MAGAMQVEGDPDIVHRCILDGRLDVHPSRSAIVVFYEVEAVVLTEFGEPVATDRKESRKIININGLCGSSDISALARQVVAHCDLIKPARQLEVEQLLRYLKNRKGGGADVLEDSSRKLREQMKDLEMSSEQAALGDLDYYLEALYEDLPAKVRGTRLILQLARTPDNLLELGRNESLFLALARVLRDDWKKSIDLTTNIIYVFFCFSTFSIFHGELSQHKIGSTCMAVVEHEIKRHKSLLEDLGKKRKSAKSESSSSAAKKGYEKSRKRYQQLVKKQETLLRVSLYLLLNLAEDIYVEQKMRNKGLVPQLLVLLERDNRELQILVVSFLKKLSIFLQNKDEMAAGGVIKKLLKVIPCDTEILVNVALRLLLNLTFDPNLRLEVVKAGLLPKLVALLSEESHRAVVLCILYHISMDQKSRLVFAYTDCIPQVMKLVLECPDELVDPETIALSINLSHHPRNAQLMCQGPGLKLLLRRALKTQDSLLLKMIRNLSQHPGPSKAQFLGFISDLGEVIKTCQDEEFAVEALGIVGNLSLPEIDFEKVVRELDLMPFIITKLKDPSVKDDILLEVIIVCGTFSLDEKCAVLLVQAGVPELLITVLKAKQEDDELVLQIVYLFYQLVLHESTRHCIIESSQAPEYLLELVNDKNQEICKLCSKTLDIIAECDPELAQKIQYERFRWYNFQWLEMMTGETLYEDEDTDEDYLDPRYLHTAAELLYDNPDLYYEMQSQIESAHSHGGVVPIPAQVEMEPGLHMHVADGYDRYGDPIFADDWPASVAGGEDYGNPSTYGLYLTAAPHGEGLSSSPSATLSPQQYAMLMNSMQDPLAMYSSSLPGVTEEMGGGGLEPSSSAELDIGEAYGGMYSPVYGESLDYDDHPAFAMMGAGYPVLKAPHPSPRGPPSRTGF